MGETININEYIEIFKKRKIPALIILIICIGAGVYLSYKKQQSYVPQYQSTISIRINSAKQAEKEAKKESKKKDDKNTVANTIENIGPSITNSSLNQSIAEKYSSLATSKRALTEIIKKLDLSITPDMLKGSISVLPQEGIPEFIDITVINRDFQIAQQIAQAVPEAFNNELIKVIGMDCVEILYDASEPMRLPKPQDNTLRNLTIVGIVLAIFVVLLLECLDNKLITPEDAEKYWGVPIIGTIPYDNPKAKGKKNIVEEEIVKVTFEDEEAKG